MAWYLFAPGELSTVGRYCYECAQFEEWANFHTLQNGRNKKASICKACKSQQRKIQRSLRKANPPPTLCEGCGEDCPLQLDHCHETNEFRAYLCVNCNLSMRRWGWGRVREAEEVPSIQLVLQRVTSGQERVLSVAPITVAFTWGV